jgi:DNA-binding MarR family transcriptional regulator
LPETTAHPRRCPDAPPISHRCQGHGPDPVDRCPNANRLPGSWLWPHAHRWAITTGTARAARSSAGSTAWHRRPRRRPTRSWQPRPGGAVHALALVVEAAAEAARSTSVPTSTRFCSPSSRLHQRALPSELADTLQLSRQTVTQALRRLADKGLVRGYAGPKADGRTVPYELTPSGRRLGLRLADRTTPVGPGDRWLTGRGPGAPQDDVGLVLEPGRFANDPRDDLADPAATSRSRCASTSGRSPRTRPREHVQLADVVGFGR